MQKKNVFSTTYESPKHYVMSRKIQQLYENINFKSSHYCVCNEKKFMQDLIIHPISYINIKVLKYEKYSQIQSQTSYIK